LKNGELVVRDISPRDSLLLRHAIHYQLGKYKDDIS
jgi:hypothetical protein